MRFVRFQTKLGKSLKNGDFACFQSLSKCKFSDSEAPNDQKWGRTIPRFCPLSPQTPFLPRLFSLGSHSRSNSIDSRKSHCWSKGRLCDLRQLPEQHVFDNSTDCLCNSGKGCGFANNIVSNKLVSNICVSKFKHPSTY